MPGKQSTEMRGAKKMKPECIRRCGWVGSEPLFRTYHDREWGVPVHDDRLLFEFLILEGAQAGLSWITILKKRDAYRAAFAGFDPEWWPVSTGRRWRSSWPTPASCATA